MKSDCREKIFETVHFISNQRDSGFLAELKIEADKENSSVSELYFNLLNDFGQRLNNLICSSKIDVEDIGKVMLMTSFSGESNYFDEDTLLDNSKIASLLRDAKKFGIQDDLLKRIKVDKAKLGSSLVNNSNILDENFISEKVISIDQYLFLRNFIDSSDDKLVLSYGDKSITLSMNQLQNNHPHKNFGFNITRDFVVSGIIRGFNEDNPLGCSFINVDLSSSES